MFKQHLIIRKIAVIAAMLAGATIAIAPSLAESASSPKQLVDEVWQILDRSYVDPSFNHQNWQAVRKQYLSRTYTSKLEAYKAIDSMVAKLGDRYTSFFDPQAYPNNCDRKNRLHSITRVYQNCSGTNGKCDSIVRTAASPRICFGFA